MVVATALPNTCSLQNPLAGSLGAAAAAGLVGGSCRTDQVSLAHRGFISQCDCPVTFIAHDDLCSFFLCIVWFVHRIQLFLFFSSSPIYLDDTPWLVILRFYSGFLLSCVDILFCDSRMTKEKRVEVKHYKHLNKTKQVNNTNRIE